MNPSNDAKPISFEEALAGLCFELAIPLSFSQRMNEYVQLVRTYGSRINLVGNLDSDFIERQLVLSSLEILRLKIPSGHLVDVGTGAGLPGIPLAIALPDLQVSLVESRRKRAAFLNRVVAQLELSNVQVIPRRIEDWRDSVADWVVSRAFRPVDEWLRLAVTLTGVGGYVGTYTTQHDWSGATLPAGLSVVGTTRDLSRKGRLVVLLTRKA